jgi:hypothetical protein
MESYLVRRLKDTEMKERQSIILMIHVFKIFSCNDRISFVCRVKHFLGLFDPEDESITFLGSAGQYLPFITA